MALLLRTHKILLIASVLVFIGLFFSFYPKFYQTVDAQIGARQAFLLNTGKLYMTSHLDAINLFYNSEKNIYMFAYPLGNAFFLSLFTLMGFDFMFLYGLVVHLITFLVFILILHKLKLNPIFSLLYLFYPVFVYYSTQLIGEPVSVLFFLLGIYFYMLSETNTKLSVLTGIAFGICVNVRYHNLIPILPFILLPLFRNRKKFFLQAAGFAPFSIIIMLYNTTVYNAPWSTGYSAAFHPQILIADPQYFIRVIISILILLNIFYPGMLLTLLVKFKYKLEFILSVSLQSIFYGFVSGFHFPLTDGTSILTIPTGSYRYVYIMIPLIIITLSIFLSRRNKLIQKIAVMILVLCAVFGSVCYLYINDLQADRIHAISDTIYEYTTEGSLIVGYNADIYIHELIGYRKYIEGMRPCTPDDSHPMDKGYPNTRDEIKKEIDQHPSVYGVLQGSNSFTQLVTTYCNDSSYVESSINSFSDNPLLIFSGNFTIDGPLSRFFDILPLQIWKLK